MRVLIPVAWLFLLAAPLTAPVVALAANPGGWAVWREADRLAALAGNTLALCAGTVLVAVPVGWFLGLWAGRFGGGGSRVGLLLAAFVPLPVYALAWQTVLGGWLPPIRLSPGEVAWRPWAAGLLPAAWVHATAAIPWVAWAVASAVRRTDTDVEDEARVSGGVRAVVRFVLLPRSLTAALLAGAWVAAQPLTEIAVTDAMMVRSAAEEVYTELLIDGAGLSAAVAAAVPVWLAAGLAGLWFGRRVARFDLTSPESVPPRLLPLRARHRWALRAVVLVLVAVFAGVPLSALVWKAAGGGVGREAEAAFLFGELSKVWRSERGLLLTSTVTALGTGLVTAFLAWVSCWAVRRSPRLRPVLFALCVLLLLAPGPVIGLGLKTWISVLMDVEELVWHRGPVWSLLYYQPTPWPVAWAALLRLFPVACLVLWPAVRAIPTELLDATRLDGFGPFATWNRVVAPLTTPAFLTAGVAVAALALGEVSAGKLVNPAGHRVFVLWLFDQMHYGSESTVAALALWQLALTGGVMAVVFTFPRPTQ